MKTQGKLQRIGARCGTDKATLHRFCDTYEHLLNKYVSRVWEIGVLDGASLRMWAEYYPKATITGFDWKDKSELELPKNAQVCMLDQGSLPQLVSLSRKESGIDIIVDDGSHTISHQIQTFETLFDCLKSGGQYIIEDLHTSTPIHHGFGFRDGRGTLQYLNDIIQYRVPTGYPGQLQTEKVIANIEQIVLIANCDTDNRRSITSIITHK